MVSLPPQDNEASAGLGARARAGPLLDEVIELVADWGAAAMPGNEEIARLLRPSSSTGVDAAGALERARAMVVRAGPLLPAELVSRLGGFETIELDVPSAPTQVRVRVALWWNEVEEALGAELSSRRAAVTSYLAPRARNLDMEVLRQAILAIGSGQGAPDATALLDQIGELTRIRALLSDAQAAVPADRKKEDGSAEGTVGAERVAGLRGAAAAAAEKHRRSGAAGLGSLLGTASETIRARLAGDGALALTTPAIDAWESTLRELVELDDRLASTSATASSGMLAKVRAEAGTCRQELVALPKARQLALEDELQTIERDIERSEGDIRALAEVVYDALRKLESLRQSLAEPGLQVAVELRAAAADLEALLTQDAVRLPVSLLMQARDLLDRVPAVIATDPDGSPGLRAEIIDLRSVCDSALASAEDEERQRVDALRAAIDANFARALQASPERDAAALRALQTEARRAPPERLPRLLDEARSHAHRREAMLRCRAVTLLTRSATSQGKGPASVAASAVRAALDANGMPRLREEVDRLAALVSIPWWTRRELLGPAVAVVLALIGFVAWSIPPASATECPVELLLPAEAEKALSIALVCDGGVVIQKMIPAGERILRVDLRPGRYEVYVDQHFTGRSFTVPESHPVQIDPVAAIGAGG